MIPKSWGICLLAGLAATHISWGAWDSRSQEPDEQAVTEQGWVEDRDSRDDLSVDVLMRSGRDSLRKVAEDREFRDGERIRLAVAAHRDGYLYILYQGSAGDTRLLYPYARGGSNFVRAGRSKTVPGSDWYRFDQEPGEETMYVVWSPRKLTGLEEAAADGGEIDLGAIRQFTTRSKSIILDDEDDDRNLPQSTVIKKLTFTHVSR